MTHIDPVAAMLEIGQHFLRRAKELDERTTAAINSEASASDITALMNLSAVDRMRALSAFEAASPFCRPRLAAVEVAPASQSTASRFEQRIANMTEAQIFEHLKSVAGGAKAIELIESSDA